MIVVVFSLHQRTGRMPKIIGGASRAPSEQIRSSEGKAQISQLEATELLARGYNYACGNCGRRSPNITYRVGHIPECYMCGSAEFIDLRQVAGEKAPPALYIQSKGGKEFDIEMKMNPVSRKSGIGDFGAFLSFFLHQIAEIAERREFVIRENSEKEYWSKVLALYAPDSPVAAFLNMENGRILSEGETRVLRALEIDMRDVEFELWNPPWDTFDDD